MNNSNGIHEYVYNKKRQPIGVFAATVSDENRNQVIIGWSRCNVNAGDRFDKKLGVKIAYERSVTASVAIVPDSLCDSYHRFSARAGKYFKDKTIVY